MRSKFKWIFTLVLALSMQFSFAQEKTVAGTVTDGKMPLPGVNVVIKGSSKGSSTDMDGKFSIKAKVGDVLVVSFIGYDSKTITVGAANSYNVTLKETAKVLDEVLVTGAVGIKRSKNSSTNAQQSVNSKELTQAASPNVIQALTGKVTGLQINTTSNGANPSSSIVLRGSRTITGNNQALVVIDNAISSATILQQLPTEIIESVNVIKGQQGAALYGEQGSNGVIIVTTKRGSSRSKTEITLSSSVDFQNISFLPKRQDKYGQGWTAQNYDYGFPSGAADPRDGNSEYSPYENGAWGPAFNDPAWANTMVPVGLPQADGSINIAPWKSRGSDNIKDFYKTGVILQNGITINSGSEDGYALFNYSNMKTDFVVDRDGMKRNYFLFKAGKKVGKFKLEGEASYTNQTVTETDSDLLYELLQTPTNVDLNLFKDSGTLHHWTVYALNPWQVIKQKRYDDTYNNINGLVRMEYQLNKHIGLTNTANIQVNNKVSTSHNDGFRDDFVVDYTPFLTSSLNGLTYSDLGGSNNYEVSSFYQSSTTYRNIYNDLMANLNYDFSSKLNFKANVGANIQDLYRNVVNQGGTDLKIPGWYNIKNVSKPDNPKDLENAYYQTRRVATFANIDFDYNKYLFLNLTGRYEKSSVIKNGFFYPSVGISFIPTSAFDNIKGKSVNYMKFYVNLSKVGNTSSVGPYATTNIAIVAPGFPYTNDLSFRPRRNDVDPNIKPEFVISKEAGAQFGFFNDRVTLDGSYYINDTKGLITNATTSTTSGLQTLLSNTGSLQNKGYELGLGLVPFRSEKGFNWNVRMGLTHYKTIVTELADGVDEVNLLSTSSVGIFAVKGEEFPLIKGSDYVRDEDGHIIVNSSGLPTISSTFKKLGKANPDYILNLSNSFSYKGLSLNVVADYRSGHSVYSSTYNSMLFAGYTLDSAEIDRANGYVIPNSVVNTSLPSTPVYSTNTIPVGGVTATDSRGLSGYYSALSSIGSYSIVDASTLKIREISLSYALPSKFLKDTGISSFKFGVNARNPFIMFFNNGKGMKNLGYTDPEASYNSGNPGAVGYSNVGQYPTTKTYGFSINVSF